MGPDFSPDLMDILRRYLVLQREEQRLREEKKTLQAALARHLEAQGQSVICPEVDGQPLKVRRQRSTQVEYDEVLLRRRLGGRYSAILAPDWRKIRTHLADLDLALRPHLDLIGSPHPDRVRFAIEQKLASVSEFDGAFRKIMTDRVSVSVIRRSEEPPPGAAVAEGPASC